MYECHTLALRDGLAQRQGTSENKDYTIIRTTLLDTATLRHP